MPAFDLSWQYDIMYQALEVVLYDLLYAPQNFSVFLC